MFHGSTILMSTINNCISDSLCMCVCVCVNKIVLIYFLLTFLKVFGILFEQTVLFRDHFQ